MAESEYLIPKPTSTVQKQLTTALLIPIIDQSNTRSANVEERKPILNRCAPEIMQRDVVGDRYRIGIVIFAIMLTYSLSIQANPWLPEPGGWKYSLQYSKYTTPKTIKFYERDWYFQLEQKQASLYKELDQDKISLNEKIDKHKIALVRREQHRWLGLSDQEKQSAKDQLYAQNPDLQILYTRIKHRTNDAENIAKYLKNLQEYLITSYHHWSATTNVEYGLGKHISYGVGIGGGRETNKFKTNSKVNSFSIFLKSKLYDKKGYVFTLQPKFLTIGSIQGADVTVMLGKSHTMKRKIFGKKAEVFGYSAFGITKFLNDNIIKKQMHAEITSGIKWNDSTILMNQESEDFNPDLSKAYKRVLRSQFTIAQDLNFASIEPQNKVYLTLSYFTIDSMKANRRLSTGYSIGLWLEL